MAVYRLKEQWLHLTPLYGWQGEVLAADIPKQEARTRTELDADAALEPAERTGFVCCLCPPFKLDTTA